ncbi:MAG: amidohydrolase family protein [Atopobiaceae bacterium]|nr:amidohydrolase family protein [Atopobiaceae bacterium]
MRFDFSQEDFFDNHTHLIRDDLFVTDAKDFTLNYFHGGRARKPAAAKHAPWMGINLTAVHMLSEFLGCEESLEAVVEARNALTQTREGILEYTKRLYEDEHIIATTLDSELPIDDPKIGVFPCKVYRLFRYEDPFFALLESEGSYKDLRDKLLQAIREAHAQGFAGLKSHVAERCSLAIREVSEAEAEAAFAAAKAGDKEAFRTVYYAAFEEICLLSAELNMPLHLHTGTSGFGSYPNIYDCDPFLMIEFLYNHKYDHTKFVLLHASWPYVRNTALLAGSFPNVYMDIAQVLPWQGLAGAQILEDAIAQAPHDKIILGSGMHNYGETAWILSKTAKANLAYVMEKVVGQGLLSDAQAERSARMILSENAFRAYEEEI